MVGPELLTFVSEMDLLLYHGFHHPACWMHAVPQDYLCLANTYTNAFLWFQKKK